MPSTPEELGQDAGSVIKKMKFGVDLSHHNGIVNWNKVKQQVDFAYLKASEGVNGIDSRLFSNSSQAAEVGVPIGYYHYATLNNEDELTDARKEAEWFIQTIKKAMPFQMPLVLDIEDDTKKVDLDDNEVLAWINTFFATLEQHGYTNYVLYSYTPFLISRLPQHHNLGNVRLWVAAYTKKPSPKIPPQWASYWLWQYSSTGKIDGINGPVDLNVFPE